MSYVTFRAVQMVFEVRDGLIKELSFFNFGNSFYSSQQFQQDLSIVTVDSKKIFKSHLVQKNIKIYYILD